MSYDEIVSKLEAIGVKVIKNSPKNSEYVSFIGGIKEESKKDDSIEKDDL